MASIYSVILNALLVIIIGWVFKRILAFLNTFLIYKFALKNINSEPAHWLKGNVSDNKSSWDEIFNRRMGAMKKYPKLTSHWIGPVIGFLIIHFPDLAQTILNTEEPKDDFVYGTMKYWIGDGLLVSHGKKWKRNRRLLTGAFHFDMLKNYLVVFNKTAKTMLDKWDELEAFPAFEHVSLMTLDSMLQCAMSAKTNCQTVGTTNSYIKAVFDLSKMIGRRFINPFLTSDFVFYNLSSHGKEFLKACKITHDHSEAYIKARQIKLQETVGLDDSNSSKNSAIQRYKSLHKRMDFLDILLLARDENNKGLSDIEIRDEVDTFLFEGHDTTASGISWALYNLAAHPDYQDRCRAEIREVLQSRNTVEWEDLNRLEYLTMCIKESLRLYPPVFSISRKLSKPLRFDRHFGPDQLNTDMNSTPPSGSGRTFPTLTKITLRILMLHRNPFVWKNPTVYNPERFTQENIAKRSPFAFLPFSAGPRNCIGQNFAMMEMKVALALCLQKFRIFIDDSYPRPKLLPAIILRADNDIHLRLEKI